MAGLNAEAPINRSLEARWDEEKRMSYGSDSCWRRVSTEQQISF